MDASRWGLTPVFLTLLVFTSACGGGGGGSGTSGTFVDSPVAALRYEGPRYSGNTTDAGRYQYVPGDTVCFYVGFVSLGCGEGRGVFSPLDLFPDARSDDDRVLNIVRFLLSLDGDGDPSNGIDLLGVRTVAADADIDFDQTAEAFETDPLVLGFIADQGFDGDLVDAETAEAHLAQSLDESFYFEQAMIGSWLYTAWDGELPDDSSKVKIKSDELPNTGIDVSEDGDVFFSVEGDRRGEICFHEGVLEEDDLVMGSIDCTVPSDVAANAVLLDTFRMDRLDPDTVFQTSDLFGDWNLASSFAEGPLTLDEGNVGDFLAALSASGKVHFETVEDLEAGPEDCVYDGQMNDTKDFASGDLRCNSSGKGSWTLETAGDAL
jgi:hypothetical protein